MIHKSWNEYTQKNMVEKPAKIIGTTETSTRERYEEGHERTGRERGGGGGGWWDAGVSAQGRNIPYVSCTFFSILSGRDSADKASNR